MEGFHNRTELLLQLAIQSIPLQDPTMRGLAELYEEYVNCVTLVSAKTEWSG